MKIKHDKTSTNMSLESLLDVLFPKQTKYREVTRDLIFLFVEKGNTVPGRSEIQVDSIVKQLEAKGHNRNTIYKVLRENLSPMGLVTWKKFEGSIQLSTKFGNSLRRISISWNNIVSQIEKGGLATEDKI